MPPYILVVEDEPDIRELLDFAISRSGFSVIEAETAEDALKVLDRGTPELIIIDWMLPGNFPDCFRYFPGHVRTYPRHF